MSDLAAKLKDEAARVARYASAHPDSHSGRWHSGYAAGMRDAAVSLERGDVAPGSLPRTVKP